MYDQDFIFTNEFTKEKCKKNKENFKKSRKKKIFEKNIKKKKKIAHKGTPSTGRRQRGVGGRRQQGGGVFG